MSAQLKPRVDGALRAEDIRLVHRIVGGRHVLTSPDVPELHLSHLDEAVVRADLQPALDALQRTRDRLAGRGRAGRRSAAS